MESCCLYKLPSLRSATERRPTRQLKQEMWKLAGKLTTASFAKAKSKITD